MAIKAHRQPRSIEEARLELSKRLEARREEIEAAVMNRVYAVADPSDLDPEYANGLRSAVRAAVDYGLVGVGLGEERSEPPPPILLAQARLAARAGVSLDTVLRRYFAGYMLLGDFLVEEVEAAKRPAGAALQALLRTQSTLFDRLLAAVSQEYGREEASRPVSTAQRRAERVERLLAGEMIDTSELLYDFEKFHLGMIACGPKAEEAARDLASRLDCVLLLVHRQERTVWAWLGGRDPVDLDELRRQVSDHSAVRARLVTGEPQQGIGGWRLTHHQARAALTVALRGSQTLTCYRDVALLASVLQDELLATSLRSFYLAPLCKERDGGKALRETLNAYFTAERNISSAAAQLGVSRRTVANRLQAVERRLGGPFASVVGHLEAALALDQLERS